MNRTTEIIYSNLFSALRQEHFGTAAAQAPMSPWKWRRVAQLRQSMDENGTYDEQQTYHFQGEALEEKREKVVMSERHNMDTSTETLALLNIIVYNAAQIQSRDISVPGVVAFGRYLRESGNRVDYVKLDAMLARLRLCGTASLMASLLIQAFGFEETEFPFRHRLYRHTLRDLCERLESGKPASALTRTLTLLRLSPPSALAFWQQRTRFALDSIEE